MKSLKKRVRFEALFPRPDGGKILQRMKAPVTRNTATILVGIVKRIGAVQVFRPKTTRNAARTREYRMSRIVDDFSFAQNPYIGRIWMFRVSTVYKTKANKVRLVDLGDSDGSKLGGCSD
jgi:hypothetical protein